MQGNPAYLVLILLARVVVRLGDLDAINPKVIEGMFAADLAYLQDFYNRINSSESLQVRVECPGCRHAFTVEPEEWGSRRLPHRPDSRGGSLHCVSFPLAAGAPDADGA